MVSKTTKKYFPIRTKTSCQLKWSWTALYLNEGISKTCHRTTPTKLTPENFNDFHNTEAVLEDRRQMLKGEWPEKNCSYCRLIEESGGVSDRLQMMDMPDMYPSELDTDPTAIHVKPTVLEVFMSNFCNLGCLYCSADLSSTINTENKKFDIPTDTSSEMKNHLSPVKSQYSKLLKSFWEWFPEGFSNLKRLHILGGEPILQKEFETILDYIENHPNPDCVLNIITNLSYPTEKLEYFVSRFKKLLVKRKLKRIDITCSIDCWGDEQEYVRYGIDLKQWEKNFEYLVKNKFLYLTINQTISTLTIKTIPELLKKLEKWRSERNIHHAFSIVTPDTPVYMQPSIFPGHIWKDDFDKILKLMPCDTERNIKNREYMEGISKSLLKSYGDKKELENLKKYLEEKDRRRGTNWKNVFPWLVTQLD